MGVYEDWQKIYGGKFGYSDAYRRRLYEEGERNIGQQYAGIKKEQTADLGERGFYSARPMQRMGLQVGTAKARALQDYQEGIRKSSEELGQQQKGQLFQGMTQETLAEARQAHEIIMQVNQFGFDVKKMGINQRYTLHRMAVQHGYDRDLAEFTADLNKPGFWDYFTSIIGSGAKGVSTYYGYKAGMKGKD